MARPLRIEYPGAWYHVMNRGAGHRTIFSADEQREFFLQLLGLTRERFNAEWHAYCLMDNHYHLLLRTPEGNLQRIMRHINGVYTQFFNRSEGQDGPLFRGRYKAVLVDAQTYWLALSRYIHRNPVEAEIVSDLAAYQWSSYRAYIGLETAPSWLACEYVLGAMETAQGAREAYRRYVGDGVDATLADFYGGPKVSPILGDDEFRKRVLAAREPNVDVPDLRSARVLPTLTEIVTVTCREFGVTESQLRRVTRGRGVTSPARAAALFLCQRAADMRLAAIAQEFGLASYGSAGAAIRNFERRLREDRPLADQINRILCDLTP